MLGVNESNSVQIFIFSMYYQIYSMVRTNYNLQVINTSRLDGNVMNLNMGLYI
jgi:hypothetical protein